MNPCSYGHKLLTMAPKTYDEEKTAFQQMLLGKLDICLQ
jgi:hypothetical protein